MQILKQIMLEEYMKRKIHPSKIVAELLLLGVMIYGVFRMRFLYLGAYMSLGLLFAYIWFAALQSGRTGMSEISCFVPRTGKGFRDYVACKSNLLAGMLAGTVCLVLGITYYMAEELVWNSDTVSLIVYISVGVYVVAKEQIAAGINAGYRKRTVAACRRNTETGKYKALRFVQVSWTGITVVGAWFALSSYEAEMLAYGETFQLDTTGKIVLYVAIAAELVIAGMLSHFQYEIAELGDYDSRVMKDEVTYEY